MKRDYPDRPLVGVGAVIVDQGRVVVVRRSHEPLKGEWSIPGGVLELGETLRAGAIREALEETGLTVEPGEVLEVFDRIVQDPEGRTQFHYVLIDFLCRPVGGEVKAGSDAADVHWFIRDELPALNLAYDANEVVLKGLAQT